MYIKAAEKAVGKLRGHEAEELFAHTIGMAVEVALAAKEAQEISGGMSGLYKLMGYDMVLMGQMMLTMADIDSPGTEDWGAWDVVHEM